MNMQSEQEMKQVLLKIVEENKYMQFLGIEFLELKSGYGLARMKFKKELLNPYGMMHGGSLYSFADIVAGTVACMEGYYVTTVSGNMNFLLPAENTEYVYCEVQKLRIGKHLAVFTIKIKNDKEEILDSGEFTFFITEHGI